MGVGDYRQVVLDVQDRIDDTCGKLTTLSDALEARIVEEFSAHPILRNEYTESPPLSLVYPETFRLFMGISIAATKPVQQQCTAIIDVYNITADKLRSELAVQLYDHLLGYFALMDAAADAAVSGRMSCTDVFNKDYLADLVAWKKEKEFSAYDSAQFSKCLDHLLLMEGSFLKPVDSHSKQVCLSRRMAPETIYFDESRLIEVPEMEAVDGIQ